MGSPTRTLSELQHSMLRHFAVLAVTNPFTPRWVERERAIVGNAILHEGRIVGPSADPPTPVENLAYVGKMVARLLPDIQERARAGALGDAGDRARYITTCAIHLWFLFREDLQGLVDTGKSEAPFYRRYRRAFDEHLGFLSAGGGVPDPGHLFAVLFVLVRAWHGLRTRLRGRSRPVERLRADLWLAIFGGTLLDYVDGDWARVRRISTLILGPTGAGKDVAAEAIGRAGYLPFDEAKEAFASQASAYQVVNLSAFAPTLVESEMFGHVKGAFTGASRDKTGALGSMEGHGALLMDEVAEIALELQVKLLRVVEERLYRRVGDEGEPCVLPGRILAATHRDPEERIRKGLLREDFFRRICLYRVVVPSLRERFDDLPDELWEMARVVAEQLFDVKRAPGVADQVLEVVRRTLPRHAWTGNMRELAQCVASVKLKDGYSPMLVAPDDAGLDQALALAEGGMSLDEINRRVVASTLVRTGSLPEAARALAVDTRRVKRIVDSETDAAAAARREGSGRGGGPRSSRSRRRRAAP
jgi:hypothetical protein